MRFAMGASEQSPIFHTHEGSFRGAFTAANQETIQYRPGRRCRAFCHCLIQVHIKDVTAATTQGTTCELSRGVIDILAFLRALIKIGHTRTVSL
jgi:hypothetical protein